MEKRRPKTFKDASARQSKAECAALLNYKLHRQMEKVSYLALEHTVCCVCTGAQEV